MDYLIKLEFYVVSLESRLGESKALLGQAQERITHLEDKAGPDSEPPGSWGRGRRVGRGYVTAVAFFAALMGAAFAIMVVSATGGM